jgi:hypothetical protein
MSQTPSRAVCTQWMIDLIDGQLPPDRKCGDAKPEAPDGLPLKFPYRVVYSIPGGSADGPPLGQAYGDAIYPYQVDSVGHTRAEAETAAAEVMEWVVGRAADGSFVVQASDPDGVRISDRIVDGTPGAPLQEGQPPNQVFTVSHTFGLCVTVG